MKQSISAIVLILVFMAGGARAETKDGKEVEGLSEEAWEWMRLFRTFYFHLHISLVHQNPLSAIRNKQGITFPDKE